jgi:hypothetical protein
MFNSLFKSIISISSLIVVVSCGSSNPRPDWVTNPGNNHVGKCGTHIKGLIYQEQCAYKKGLTYIAMTKGVTAEVSANMDISQNSHGGSSSRGALKANITMQGKEIQIKGKVVQKWHDRVRDVFYVLIQEQ